MHDKLEAIQSWLQPLLSRHRQALRQPFVLGVSGVQGSGKSTLVKELEQSLIRSGLHVAQLSLDDLYLTYQQQLQLAQSGVQLWQSRGQFGTHDVNLARQVMEDLRAANPGSEVRIPRYDKSLYAGRGDRMPESEWDAVHGPIDVIILEGWGVGFQALDEATLTQAYEDAQGSDTQMAKHALKEIEGINSALRKYNEAFMGSQHFDALLVLQAEETRYVYQWRLQQEHAMWKVKGSGMTDDQVEAFVDRYYPSYELYLPRSIEGIFNEDKKGHQLNLKMDIGRALMEVVII